MILAGIHVLMGIDVIVLTPLSNRLRPATKEANCSGLLDPKSLRNVCMSWLIGSVILSISLSLSLAIKLFTDIEPLATLESIMPFSSFEIKPFSTR